ncbi:hypothetical protein [Moraxella oculi]|nr:hypothetical protein [Moraxella sp. Tifton1]
MARLKNSDSWCWAIAMIKFINDLLVRIKGRAICFNCTDRVIAKE